jgi:HAD superfamily hydrolase (TIGR01458 family)
MTTPRSRSAAPLRGLLIDLDGVLYVGDRPVPGAAEAAAWLRAREIPHLFVTNTTSRPRGSLVARLAEMGVLTEASRILTPPVAAMRWLREHAPGPVALFVPKATAVEFASLPKLPADAECGAASVVVGDLGESWDFATLNRAFRLLMAQPPPRLVALGMTRYWRSADGLRLDVAPFIVGLEHATGCRAVVLGKPAPPFFEAALDLLGEPAANVAMIGDDIVGDVGAAQTAGMRGVLVRTGKYRPADLEREIAPDAVLESFADLPGWWEKSAAH